MSYTNNSTTVFRIYNIISAAVTYRSIDLVFFSGFILMIFLVNLVVVDNKINK